VDRKVDREDLRGWPMGHNKDATPNQTLMRQCRVFSGMGVRCQDAMTKLGIRAMNRAFPRPTMVSCQSQRTRKGPEMVSTLRQMESVTQLGANH
jgi:hypothetical protein